MYGNCISSTAMWQAQPWQGKPEEVFAILRLLILTAESAAVASSHCMHLIWELVHTPLAAVGCCVPAILSHSVRCFVLQGIMSKSLKGVQVYCKLLYISCQSSTMLQVLLTLASRYRCFM